MNWLHFSDFHVGRARGPQTAALKSLLLTLEREFKATPTEIHAIFLAGDIAHSGRSEQYDRFTTEFLEPLKLIPGISNAKIFAVPGNHDVDCDVGVPISWETIDKKRDIFFCEDPDGVRARSARNENFAGYQKFTAKHSIFGPSPSREVSKFFELPDFPADVLVTNTAFFSDESEHKKPKSTPVPFNSLRKIMPAGVNRRRPVFVLGHHSPASFRGDHSKQFNAWLNENRAVYIHGHEHDPSTTFNGSGELKTLGFGATYLEHPEKKTEGAYKNTFAICSLSDRLYIKSFSWEWEIGQWKESSEVQFGDCEKSSCKVLGGCMGAKIPLLNFRDISPSVAIGVVPRETAKPTRIVPIDLVDTPVWKLLFRLSDNLRPLISAQFTTQNVLESDEKKEFSISDGDERHLVICIPGINHILSLKEVETFNTRLDTEDYTSVTVLSLGRVSEEAKRIYVRLQGKKKRIEILANNDLTTVSNALLTDPQKRFLAQLDSAATEVHVLVSSSDVYCLIISGTEPNGHFYVLDPKGTTLSASDPLVASLRRGNPDLVKMPYKGSEIQVNLATEDFSEANYLVQCFKEYNSTKYAALAHIGLRFDDVELRDLYVDATAREVAGSGTTKVEAMVEDHLSTLPLSDALKSHIQRDLLSSLEADPNQETSAAREFCQRYPAVLLTGDPGAGKTCFVKNEILAYCERSVETENRKQSDWHASHVPLMLQLSELAAEPDLNDVEFFTVACRLLARRAISITARALEEMATQGRLAMFFDGLDEVVSIEKRSLVVRLINDLSHKLLPSGNRFVVTSRPAAVQIVNLLPTFHKLELQGLSEANISLLAQRVLSVRLTETQEGPILDQSGSPSGSNGQLLHRLLKDCRENPGVARLAQNPLLLTLLILIYANAGAPSAKRHAIYEQAIKTLSAVRGRETGHAIISAQDLRERLGKVALSVYRNESGLLPTKSEVAHMVREVIEKQRGEAVELAEADYFIQQVAESTGLISIGKRRHIDGDAVITFMHHSFLEYFAAIGLSLEFDSISIEELVHKPRWHEILTLLAGIIGENADIAPYINRFLNASATEHDVDGKVLCFAMDCALECDVASESAQRLISRGIEKSIKFGAAKADPWVRSELGVRLCAMISACGMSHFTSPLLLLLADASDDRSASAVRMCGYAFKDVAPPKEIVLAVEKLCERNADSITGAICWMAGENPHFRSEKLKKLITESLQKGRRRRQFAFEALAKLPDLAAMHWPEIIAGIEDDDASIKRSASQAAVQAGLNADIIALSANKKDVLLRALRYADEFSASREISTRVRGSTLDSLLESADKNTRMVGIGLIPLGDWEDQEIFARLMEILRDRTERGEIAAAMISLRHAGTSLALTTQGDLKCIMSWVERGTNDICIQGLQLLSMFGRDISVVSFLIGLDHRKMEEDEFSAFMVALGNSKTLKSECVTVAVDEVLRLATDSITMGKENVRRLGACLDALKRLEENVVEKCSGRVRALIDDFRTDETIRRRALVCLPAISIPSPKLLQYLEERLRENPAKFESELVQVPSIFARKCKQDVDYVLACVNHLGTFKDAAVTLHKSISNRPVNYDNEFKASELRNGITEIGSIVAAFNTYLAKTPVKRDAVFSN